MTQERTPEVRCGDCGWVGVQLANHLHRSSIHQFTGPRAMAMGGVVDCRPLFGQMEAARANVRQAEALRGAE